MGKATAVACLMVGLSVPAWSQAVSEVDQAYSQIQYSIVQRDWRVVIEHARRILAVQPDRADMHRLVGESLLKLNRSEEALVSFREWARLEPESSEATAALAQATARQEAVEAQAAAREREREAARRTTEKPSLAALARERRAKIAARTQAEPLEDGAGAKTGARGESEAKK